jgi:hypothetical protein
VLLRIDLPVLQAPANRRGIQSPCRSSGTIMPHGLTGASEPCSNGGGASLVTTRGGSPRSALPGRYSHMEFLGEDGAHMSESG